MRSGFPPFFWLFLLAVLQLPLCSLCAAELTYEKDVRPIFKTHCFHCHGEDGALEGGLDLRLRRLIAKGGESGKVIVPGEPKQSLLMERLHAGDMPPEDVSIRPSASEIATISNWIATGAIASRPEPADLNPDNYITEEERNFWAFQPVVRTNPPDVKDDSRVRTPIDRFVIQQLEANALSISSDADARTTVRRVYFDLLGLPPTPAETKAYTSDQSADAYGRLVDRVLASPRYGERWGRHWLDVAGYADSEGYTEDDPVRPFAWKYRDYVILAFNTDKPFDEFVIEQLAGDELVTQPFAGLPPRDIQKLIATGFLRMAPDGSGANGVDQELARNEVVAKTIQIVSTSLLGLTVSCAQCHNHRYDPISQEDYYAMRAIFEPSLDPKKWLPPTKHRVSLITKNDRKKAAEVEVKAKAVLDLRTKKQTEFIEATFQRELAKLDESLREPLSTARNTDTKKRTPAQVALLKKHPSINVTASSLYLYDKKAADELKKLDAKAKAIRATKPKEAFVRAVWETPGRTPPETFLFHRGDHEQPRQKVAPRGLSVLSSETSLPFPATSDNLSTTGRRLAYARQLTSGDHPLLSRVIVNRVWLHHFGRGLVTSPGDFGALGDSPTHPELLDFLAAEFVTNGWSVKYLHRLIMNSTTYRQSSRRNEHGDKLDSENTWYWRMPIRRLNAESLRDTALHVTGELNTRQFGSPVPVMADRVGRFVVGKENLNAGRPGALIDMKGEDLRRSVYIQSRRSRPLSVLAPFDLPRMEPNCTSRSVSTVSPQSLMLMNSDFVLARADRFAVRLHKEAGDDLTRQIILAWNIAFASEPDENQLADAKSFLEMQTSQFIDKPAPLVKGQPKRDPAMHALASFCHALLSSNRFLYID